MKYQLIALPALAATVAAQDLYVEISNQTEFDHKANANRSNSIIQVLQTALPSSLVAEALTNSAAVGSEIASQFAAGETPTWFTALPTDIQGYLVPTDLAGVSSLTAAASSLVSSASSAGFTGVGNASTSTPITTAPGVIGTGTLINNNGTSVVAPNGTIIGNNNGTAAGNSSSSLSSGLSSSASTRSSSNSQTTSGSGSGSNSGSNSGSSSSTASEAGAAMPTAFFGMGLAGAVGMIGVLAL
jgi:hypothetical protein